MGPGPLLTKAERLLEECCPVVPTGVQRCPTKDQVGYSSPLWTYQHLVDGRRDWNLRSGSGEPSCEGAKIARDRMLINP
jgi:hypothetical protein